MIAARHRIAEFETELAIHRRAAELLDAVVPPKGATARTGGGRYRSAIRSCRGWPCGWAVLANTARTGLHWASRR